LITASILSKKLAEGVGALLLDVKFGRAAFMQSLEQARALAQTMVQLGGQFGLNIRALLTDMNTPLGRAAGNWLEVKEAVACLEGNGPPDLVELVTECAAHLRVQAGRVHEVSDARKQVAACLAADQPRRKWDEMLAAQGADLKAFQRKLARDTTAPVVLELTASCAGFVTHCDARSIGEIIRSLGGGRLSQESVINPDVGIDRLKKPGEPVNAGSVLCRLHAATQGEAEAALARLSEAFRISEDPPQRAPLILEAIMGRQVGC